MTVDYAIVQPIMDLYKKMMVEIRANGNVETIGGDKKARSIGTFLREGFRLFLSQQANVPEIERLKGLGWPHSSPTWSLRSLQDAVFSMQEYMERIATAANSLSDLDLYSEHEYREFPGEQITIGNGYMSVINELARCLPAGTIQFGKKVHKFIWNRSPRSGAPVLIHCEDGCLIEADHVIITLSLGVLKASTSTSGATKGSFPWADPEGKPVCRSIYDLQVRFPAGEANSSLFEPPLPSCKVEAISRLGYGVVDKLFLQLDPTAEQQLRTHVQLMYRNDGFSKEPNPWWMRKTFSLAPIYKDSSVLLCWFAGDEALEMEGLSDEEVMRGVANTLARFGVVPKSTSSGRKEGHNRSKSSSSDSEESSDDGELRVKADSENFRSMFKGVLRSRWGRNALFHGSYSYAATGSSGLDFETIAEPLPKASNTCESSTPLQLLFAGEATDRYFYSTTHGAHRSGLREANRLLRHYGLSHVEPV